ncbi:hypothetical protein [Shinella sp. BYT-45]|uniref:hypothetical protein n=1 Tax=Shinella sp. BYT-45 TaxID=3377377 RepID=UPI00397ED9A2
MSRLLVSLVASAAVVFIGNAFSSHAAETDGKSAGQASDWCATSGGRRTVCADVVALDQTLVYNRFGSFNPFGMIFALRRDVVPATEGPEKYDADACGQTDGTETYRGSDALKAGAVRLKDCKRPRPMVLRANAGDILRIRVQNLLRDSQPRYSEDFCRSAKAEPAPGRMWEMLGAVRSWISEGTADRVDHKEADCRVNTAGKGPGTKTGNEPDADAPATRLLSIAIQGLTLVPSGDGIADRVCLGQRGIKPGVFMTCTYKVDEEGTYFLSSTAAPSGGEGDGGSITHGLFGAVIGEPKESTWYRSQVSSKAFTDLWGTKPSPRHAVKDMRDTFENLPDGVGGVPILAMARRIDERLLEIVHSDLNAIVQRDAATRLEGRPQSFREFSVFFHDELKTFYTRNFSELSKFGEGQLAGVRDGFAINYGSSGMGAALLANRKGIGPAADCAECLYEEFFLTSWANGDPALLEQFSDDPSNVHHSYLNDPVVFRNFHAGPKETHVFHLHAHQWFSGNDANRGAYLDSQTVAPQQGFTYDIYGGGMQIYRRGAAGEKGWYETLGSGNRNRTVGDSIFHCHLYPHFAQGMWELWRVHDVLEDGTRKLPDGQWEAGLSLAEMSKDTRAKKRPGSVTAGGAWINPVEGSPGYSVGTPTPALVPLPGEAWPLLPTYSGETTVAAVLDGKGPEVAETGAFPGYPYYIGGKPGHRPAQAPLDIARATAGDGVPEGEYLDGGLPRHIVLDEAERKPGVEVPADFLEAFAPNDVTDLASAENNAALRKREARQSQLVAKMLALGDLTMHLEKAPLELLPYDGTALEKAAMAFHHNGSGLDLLLADGSKAEYDLDRGGYARAAASGGKLFTVNGGKAKPGAPFADPCAAPDSYRVLVHVPASGSGPASYTFDGRPVYFTSGAVDQIPAGTAHVAARDEDVSNWVKWRRSDKRIAKRPALYYLDDAQRPTALADQDSITVSEVDPFTGEAGLTTDPGVVGFRRYKASAVQLDMVTNKAGWHDPQARINVLTERSHTYKGEIGSKRISPLISAGEQPFFFRALSGECIEFRHTNELPKELALDDFQVKTPTDTIGQHIHLVKFDVTSSDGSGNGFNYEDGTFAPDEIATRICAAKNAGMATFPEGDAVQPQLREFPGLCRNEAGDGEKAHWVVDKDQIWRLSMQEGTHRRLFQTTTQRWFADPLLSPVRRKGDGGTDKKDEDYVDRTLRTVFSHDHFGPSSIQQHGFYTALLIEPQGSQTCEVDGKTCTQPRIDRQLIDAKPIDVGREKIIVDFDALDDVSTREFALAVADFATLYDPSDTMRKETLLAAFPDRTTDSKKAGATMEEPKLAKGMATLYCEAKYARLGQTGNMNEYCGSGISQDKGIFFAEPGNMPPAWLAAAMPKDSKPHSEYLFPDLITPEDVDSLRDYLTAYRQKAAGNDGNGVMARPVAAVQRPESISVDHHDPYLVNYRGEPIPLRIGTDGSQSLTCEFKESTPEQWVEKLESGVSGSDSCSISTQKNGDEGDLANVFLSGYHNDPATHTMKTMTGDRVQFRLVQGAQEVQHAFTLEGYTWSRNIDQRFPSAMLPRDDTAPRVTLTQKCDDATFLVAGTPVKLIDAGHADEYFHWLRHGAASLSDSLDFWEATERGMESCINREGRVSAQEIGISEHFEFSGTYRNDISTERFGLADGMANAAALPSDTLQHFGSQDSLWNGAWSLLRTYPKGSDDIAPVAEAQARAYALKTALGDSAKDKLPGDGEAERAGAFANAQPAACRYEAPLVHAAVVAIEARTVFGPDASTSDVGTTYGPGLYDRNGLFLAQVDPMAIVNPKPDGVSWPDYLQAPDAWRDIKLDKVVQAIKAAYRRPEPLVLPVKAGDCVMLTVINALRKHSSFNGLIDDLGDARMPSIVSLNTEPEWATDDEKKQTGSWHFTQKDASNVRPSSRFALMLPLPTLSYTNAVARPFGNNATGALAGLAAGAKTLTMDESGTGIKRTAQIEQISFYAGRAAAKGSEDLTTVTIDDNHAEDFINSLNIALAGTLNGRQAAKLSGIDLIENGSQAGDFSFAGRAYKISVTLSGGSVVDLARIVAADEGARRAADHLWQAYARLTLSEKVNFIPYAYGALPIKSMGDVIGHPTHGLIGSVNVLPVGAIVTGEARVEIGQLTFERDLCNDTKPSNRGRDCRIFVTKPVVGKAGHVNPFGELRILTKDPQGAGHDIRLFTLFWQDGLNLRDRSTTDSFAASDGSSPDLVTDCTVCDDTYDFGDQGVSHRSSPFHIRLRKEPGNARLPQPERHTDLNAYKFPVEFFRLKRAEIGKRDSVPVLKVVKGEEVIVHVVHPGGRARQHAFATIGQNYNDLFPGFGFPRSALVAPGKAVTASLTRKMAVGCYLFQDGPTYLQAGGLWGLIDVVANENDLGNPAKTSCARTP